MTSRVLLDAANLRVGGGVQVAASFFDELAALQRDQAVAQRFPWLTNLDAQAAPEVLANLREGTASTLGIREVVRRPTDPVNWRKPPQHDVAFSLFGPLYGRRLGRYQVVGFADGTSVFDQPPSLPPLPRSAAARAWLRRRASRVLFRQADHLVVEAQHVKDTLVQRWRIPAERISVVPNCVHAAFLEPRRDSSNDKSENKPKNQSGWCFVSRAYPHKNLALLGRIGDELAARGVHDVRFTVTLDDAEWAALDAATRRVCDNVGPQQVLDLPSLYDRSEGSVFPSLLESFSVTPLEALARATPLVASDRRFVRDVCSNAALYADPDDPAAWADAILRIRQDADLRTRLIEQGQDVTHRSPSARDRALSYLEIIDAGLRGR